MKKHSFPISNEDLFSFLRTAFWICFPVLIANFTIVVVMATTDHYLLAEHEKWKQKDEPRIEELWWQQKHAAYAKGDEGPGGLPVSSVDKKSLNRN